MIENYKGWDIILKWDENSFYFKDSYKKNVSKDRLKWEGVNLNGKKIYGSSLKEIRHIIDYPDLYNKN